MCLKAVDVRRQIRLMEEVIVLQLTPKVHKDPYLFVSGLRVIYFDIPILMEKDISQNRLTLRKNCILNVGNFENCFHPFLGMFLCCIVLYSI